VGNTIQVIRAPRDGESERRVITIDIAEFQRGNVALDVPIYANDTINVLSAGSIFTVGELIHPDEFVLRNGKNITVLQAISKSGGATKEAKKKELSIVRVHEDGKREEIPVNLESILQGKADDIEMMPNDILFVPPNKVKAAINRTLESTIGVVSNRLIYRF
jgi:protein involved in polysaccharide export with SLBB domain